MKIGRISEIKGSLIWAEEISSKFTEPELLDEILLPLLRIKKMTQTKM